MKKFFALGRRLGGKLPIRVLGWLGLGLFPLFCLFILDYFNLYSPQRMESLQKFWEAHPLSVWFEVLIMLTLMALLLLLCRKGWIAGTALGFFSLLFAFINYTKVALNGDNFMPRDISMVKSGGELISFISISMPRWFYLAAAIMVVWILMMAFFNVEVPIKWNIRVPVGLALIAFICFYFSSPTRSEKVINKFSIYFENTILQASNYKANGFVGAFTLNILCMQEQAPSGYSQAKIQEILVDYSETAATGEDFDVIVVLSESFSDIRELPGLEFSENPLSNYDELITRSNCYSGKMYTTSIGGGTVRTEFDVLTGLATDYLHSGSSPWEKVTSDLDGYVSNYKAAGYHTIALHPYNKSFYSRDSAYSYVGFDEFYGQSELASMLTLQYKRGYATDASTLEAIEYFLDSSDEPTFIYAITMENHQPYNASDPDSITVSVTSDDLESSVLDSVVTYTQGVYDADKMLGDLADYIDSRERPTILLFFGDHRPTLGSNYAAYDQSGFIDSSDGFDDEERLKMYSSPFVIYSNRDIDIDLFDGNADNEISSYNVLNAVALATGFHRTPYMNLLLDFYSVAPKYNVRLELDTTDEIDNFSYCMRLITYDRLCGGNYSAEK
jgi:phosphoglycerol transferase MdoB-like AlkP superfamily enzyme